MDDKKFGRLMAIVITLGFLSTAAMLGYILYLYDNCSIIAYIGNGG